MEVKRYSDYLKTARLEKPQRILVTKLKEDVAKVDGETQWHNRSYMWPKVRQRYNKL